MHKTNALMDWSVPDVLHYRPYECLRKFDSCISFHKGTTDEHRTYGEESGRCFCLNSWDEDLEHIYIECSR